MGNARSASVTRCVAGVGAQHVLQARQRLGLVLDLRALVEHTHTDTGRLVDNQHARTRHRDVLTATPVRMRGRTTGDDFEIVLVNGHRTYSPPLLLQTVSIA